MANSKITALTDIVTPAVADIIPIVDDVAGTPTTKKATLQEVFDLYKDLTITETNKTLTSPKINENVTLTATATQLNITNGLTATQAEINALHSQTGAWTSYNPSWSNVTLGGGTSVGVYVKIGKTVHYRIKLTFAANTSITGTPSVSLPVSATANYGSVAYIGLVNMTDSNGGAYVGVVHSDGIPLCQKISGNYIEHQGLSSTVPFTWATGDTIQMTGTYEAA